MKKSPADIPHRISGIYKIESPCGDIYIGRSNDIRRRFKRYKSGDCKQQSGVWMSFVKHGIGNHSFTVLEECCLSDLVDREEYYISLFNSFNTPHGLNLMSGGRNPTVSNITIKRLSEFHMGHTHNIGKIRSEEVKQRLRILNTGKKHSEETKMKMSLAQKGRIGPLAGVYGEKHHRSKICVQLSKDGFIINHFHGQYEASRETGIPVKMINKCIKGHSKTAKGFIFV